MPPHKEQSPFPEFEMEIVNAYTSTFIQREDCYPIQLEDGKYATVKKTFHINLITAHLQGRLTLGAYALDTNHTARWLCFDADNPNQWAEIQTVAQHLEREGITAYLENSRRGGHCWLFTPPLEGTLIRQFGKQLLTRYDLKKMELYPKQDKLITGTGSLVRLPLGIHRKTGKRYSFITPTGQPLAPTIRDQIRLLASPNRVPQDFIDKILAEIEPAPPPIEQPFRKVSPASGETLSERIKASISVLDFVSRYVELDHAGRGFCPFHDDQHQSFGVHRERNFWHCYAGCEGQTVIDFWMKWREKHGQNSSFTATVTDLAKLLF